jgi:hypothetical protein
MTLRAFWLTGVVGLLAALALAGCSETEDRAAAKEAISAQTAAEKEMRLVAVTLANASLEDENRAAQVVSGFAKAEAPLRSLLKGQPKCWQVQSQLGSVLLAKGDFFSARVTSIMTRISQRQDAAMDAWRYVKTHQAERARSLAQQSSATTAETALAAIQAKYKAELATRQQAIEDAKARCAELLKLAATQGEAGKAEDDAGKALIAEADKMPLGKSQLAKLGEGEDKQSHAANFFAQAAILEYQAKVLFNAEARKAAEKGLADNRVRTLLDIPDEVAGHELAIDMIQGRLTDLEKAQADTHQAVTSTAPDVSKADVGREQERAAMNLEHLAADAAAIEQAAKAADEAYDAAITELNSAKLLAQQASDGRELSIRVELSNAYRGKGILHLTLAGLSVSLQEVARIANDADLASLPVKGDATVGQLMFGGYQAKDCDTLQRDLAGKSLSESAWVLDDSDLLAQQVESRSINKDIREGQLWSQRVLKDRRAELEKQLGESIPRRQAGPAAPAGPAGPAAPASPAGPGVPPAGPSSGGPVATPAGPSLPASQPTP